MQQVEDQKGNLRMKAMGCTDQLYESGIVARNKSELVTISGLSYSVLSYTCTV